MKTPNKIQFIAVIMGFVMNAHAAIEIQNIESCICPGHPGRPFEVIATGTAGPFTFSWEGPDNYTSTDQNPANITTPGQYTVSVTNAYGCAVILQSSVPACAPVELQGDIQGGDIFCILFVI